jgi:hypothetical protein
VALTVVNNSNKPLKLRFSEDARGMLGGGFDDEFVIDPFDVEIFAVSASTDLTAQFPEDFK